MKVVRKIKDNPMDFLEYAIIENIRTHLEADYGNDFIKENFSANPKEEGESLLRL